MPAGSPEARANLPVQPPENTRGGSSSFGQKPPERPSGGTSFDDGAGAYKATELRAERVVFDQNKHLTTKPDFDRWPEIGYPPVAGGQGECADQGVEGDGAENEVGQKKARNYYEGWLRKKHPQLPEEEITQEVEAAMKVEEVRAFIADVAEFAEEIKGTYPDGDFAIQV